MVSTPRPLSLPLPFSRLSFCRSIPSNPICTVTGQMRTTRQNRLYDSRSDAAVDPMGISRLVARASLSACRAWANVWFACETARHDLRVTLDMKTGLLRGHSSVSHLRLARSSLRTGLTVHQCSTRHHFPNAPSISSASCSRVDLVSSTRRHRDPRGFRFPIASRGSCGCRRGFRANPMLVVLSQVCIAPL